MKDASEIRDQQRSAKPTRGLSRRSIAALLGLAVVAFGFGPLASPTHAKAEERMTPKVVGGSVAPSGSWPSQAYVLIERSDGFYFCGGTLVYPKWVLTAAHCVVDGSSAVSAGSVETAVGIQDLSDIKSSDRIGIRSVSVHPRFSEIPETGELFWDFALLQLERTSTQRTTALIAPGQEASTAGGQPGLIAGWGCTSQVPPGGSCPESPPLPSDLIEAQVSFVSDDECASPPSYGGGFDRESMICAGNFETGLPDTCMGDSGGPLIAFGPGGERLLAGITSFGDGCATPDFPGVYARVLAGRPWILQTVNRKGPTVSLRAKPARRALRRKATFKFRASQSGSTFKCRLDGRSWRKCKSPKTYKHLKRGRKHTFRVKARKDGITGPVKKYTWYVKRH